MLRLITDRPGSLLLGFGIAVTLGIAADIAAPLLPALPILLALGLFVLVAGIVLVRRQPDAERPWDMIALASPLVLVWGLLALLQLLPGHARGVLAAHFDAPAALQDALIGPTEGNPRETAELRAALATSDAPLRPRPASADEFLYNALLLHAREEPVRAARALAEALRRTAEPRPDALLLAGDLLATGMPAVTEMLAVPPNNLAEPARAHLAALRLPPAERIAALTELLAREPDWTPAAVELVRTLRAASGPAGPTVAAARRMVTALDVIEHPDGAEPLSARFLDPAGAARLGRELAELAPLREFSTRQLAVTTALPPPGTPNAPLLVRLTPPEPATAVQVLRAVDVQGEVWAHVPQRTDDSNETARDPVPTLRLTRPFRPAEMRFRYLDREGVASEPVVWRFDPVPAMREAAQRAVQRPGPFAFYQPGRVAPGRLNSLPIAGIYRPGLRAVEWFSDAERRPRSVPVGVPDEAVLAAEIPRTLVEFAVPQGARSLFLVAVYADGSRSPLVEMPIR